MTIVTRLSFRMNILETQSPLFPFVPLVQLVNSCTVSCPVASKISKSSVCIVAYAILYIIIVLAGSIELQTSVPPVLPEILIV